MSTQQKLPLNYFHHQLPNGIEMIGQYMSSLNSISLGFQLEAAVVHEPEEKSGLAHLFEYMLFQGTKHKDARALNEAFESLGARKGASTSMENISAAAMMTAPDSVARDLPSQPEWPVAAGGGKRGESSMSGFNLSRASRNSTVGH